MRERERVRAYVLERERDIGGICVSMKGREREREREREMSTILTNTVTYQTDILPQKVFENVVSEEFAILGPILDSEVN